MLPTTNEKSTPKANPLADLLTPVQKAYLSRLLFASGRTFKEAAELLFQRHGVEASLAEISAYHAAKGAILIRREAFRVRMDGEKARFIRIYQLDKELAALRREQKTVHQTAVGMKALVADMDAGRVTPAMISDLLDDLFA